MTSERISIGIMVTNFDKLCGILRKKKIGYRACNEQGSNGERYLVVGPIDVSQEDKFKNCNLVDEYVLLGAGKGNLDDVEKYLQEHDGVASTENDQKSKSI